MSKKLTGAAATAWLLDTTGRAADRLNLGYRFGMDPDPRDLDVMLPDTWTDEHAREHGYTDRAEACVDAAVNDWWRDAWEDDAR